MCDGDTVLAKNQADQILAYFHIIRTNQWTVLTPPLFGVPAKAWYDYVVATDAVSEHYNSSNLPTLFLGLGLDINVPPAELLKFENEVEITDDFWSIPGLVHYMTPPDDPHVSEVLTDTIIYWLREHFLHTSVSPNALPVQGVSVYPNPFSNEIVLVFSEKMESPVRYRMSNASGVIVFETDTDEEIDAYTRILRLPDLSAGTYHIHLMQDGKSMNQMLVRF
jgi:hypothetical protein